MKVFKRVIAAATAAAAVLSVTGCADISKVGTVNGEEIKAGVYLWFELAAMAEAKEEVDAQLEELGQTASDIDNFSYFDYNVQDKSYSQYITDRTEEFVKQYVAISEKCDEMGITLTDEEKAEVKDSATELWATDMTIYGYTLNRTYGEYYEDLGISKASYQAVQLVDKLNNKLFDAHYDEKGVTPTDEQDIKVYFDDNYARFYIIQVALEEGSGDPIETDEGKAEMKKLAQGYLDRLLGGEDYDAVYHDYEKYVEEQKKAAEAEKEEDKKKSADETASDSAASENTTSDETTSEETTSDDTSSDDKAEDKEEEEHDHEFLLSATDTSPSEEFIEWAFKLDEEKGGVYEDEDIYYVVVRKPLLERTDWYDTYRLDILHQMKDDEFEEVLNEFAKDYEVDFTDEALSAYAPEKIRTK